MILGKPTLQTVLDLLEDEGCQVCGELPTGIQVDGPDAIRLGCGHIVDVKDWIDSHYMGRNLNEDGLTTNNKEDNSK